jgi:His-Xaa-Ser repeat protein HxsA
MKRFRRSLVLFTAGLPVLSGQSTPGLASDQNHLTSKSTDPVDLRPLNLPGDNLFAAHRSHSSHGSHRSSSGGTRAAPRQPSAPLRGTSRPTDPGRAAPVSPSPAPSAPKPQLSMDEKRRLQIMQVQIALTGLGLYQGGIDGILGEGTKEALKRFQAIKGLPQSGLMTTDTLNGLGVPAVK